MNLLTRHRPSKSLVPSFWNEDDWFNNFKPLSILTDNLTAISDIGAVNLYEQDGKLIAEMDLPGFDPNKVEVNVENNTLKISAKACEDKQENKEDAGRKYHVREIMRRSFDRELPLPCSVKEKEASAEYEGGLLKVTIPKQEAKNEKIKIQIKK